MGCIALGARPAACMAWGRSMAALAVRGSLPPSLPNHPLVGLGQGVATMKNDEGEIVDLYIPRKCSWTNKLITAKDHGSVQINIGHLDESGVYTNSFSTFALCGQIRVKGEADSALDHLWAKKRSEIGQ